MKENRISKEFADRTFELARKTEKEIEQMLNDYVETKKSLGKTVRRVSYGVYRKTSR